MKGTKNDWANGAPPAGEKCEINLYGYWIIATVLAYGKTTFIYEIAPGQVDDEGDLIGGELAGVIDCAEFRPIKTKAERERYDWINRAAKAAGFPKCPATRKVCEDIYDGMIKVKNSSK